MSNTQAICSSFKIEVMKGSHALGTQSANATRSVTTVDVIKAALYTAAASPSVDATTTAYSATGELAASGNYAAGGVTVTNANAPTLDGTTGHWTPSASLSWANLTSSAAFDAVLIYNSSSTGKLSISVHTFGSQSVTAGTFTLTMPTDNGTTGLVRIA